MKTLVWSGGSMGVGKGAVILVAVMFAATFSPLHAQCSLDMAVSTIPAQQLSIADVDFEHFGGSSLLFTINITNSSGAEARASLRVRLDIDLADGSKYLSAITFTTFVFPVSPAGKMITNLDLGRNGTIATRDFDFSDDARTKLQDVALATGRFPAGKYDFHLELDSVNCGEQPPHGDVVFLLQNPSRVELRSPNDGAATNEFPFFEFYQEASKAVLTVAEKTDDQSREDAISRTPPMLQVELGGQNSYMYTGGRPLEEGKTYVWNIVSKSVGSGGTDIDVASPIWAFTVSSSPQSPVGSAFFDRLRQAFPKYKSQLDQLQKDGFVQTGVYTLNGTPISEADLLDLLIQLRDNDSVLLSDE